MMLSGDISSVPSSWFWPRRRVTSRSMCWNPTEEIFSRKVPLFGASTEKLPLLSLTVPPTKTESVTVNNWMVACAIGSRNSASMS